MFDVSIVLFLFVLGTGFLCVALTVLELILQTSQRFTCLCLLGVVIRIAPPVHLLAVTYGREPSTCLSYVL